MLSVAGHPFATFDAFPVSPADQVHNTVEVLTVPRATPNQVEG